MIVLTTCRTAGADKYHYVEDEKPLVPQKRASTKEMAEASSPSGRHSSAAHSSSTARTLKPLRQRRKVDAKPQKPPRVTPIPEEEPSEPAEPTPSERVDDSPMDMDHGDAGVKQQPPQDRKTSIPRVPAIQKRNDSYPTAAQWHESQKVARRRQTETASARLHRQWQASVPSTISSFDSSNAGQIQLFDPYQADTGGQSLYPGNHDFGFPQYAQHPPPLPPQQPIQVQQVQCVPHPLFDTVPNTPVFSPTTLTYPQFHQQVPAMHQQHPAQGISAAMSDLQLMHSSDAPQGFPYPAQYVDANQFVDLKHYVHPNMVQPVPQQHEHTYGMPTTELQQPVAGGLPYLPQQPATLMPYPESHLPYPDHYPLANCRSAAHMERDFTGYSSGVGGGQPT